MKSTTQTVDLALEAGDTQEKKPIIAEKRVQIPISQLKKLANNSILLNHFIEVIEQGEVKSPFAYQMAEILTRQKQIEWKNETSE